MSETQQVTNGKTPPIPPAKSGKKRKFDLAFKKQIVARVKGGESSKDVARATGVNGSQIRNWVSGRGLGPMGGGHSTKKKKNKRVDESVGAKSYIVLPTEVKDAIKFLKHAQAWMYASLQSGVIAEFDEAHDLSRMALRELQKLAEK